MPNCNHEEADTRIIVHLEDAVSKINGNAPVTTLIRTVDTDVVVILIGKFYDLIELQDNLQIWVAFGMGKNYRYLSINRISEALGEAKSRALPLFHAFSGCDTTSQFNGKGKISAWQAWSHCEEVVTSSLEYLSSHPFEKISTSSMQFKSLERLTIALYDKSSSLLSVNELRMELFCKKNRQIDHLPPTQVTKTSFDI